MTDAFEYFPPRLRGQVAVITGAARGLGREKKKKKREKK